MLLSFVVTLIINIGVGNNSFAKIFTINNFENLYAPLIISASLLLDTLITRIIFKKEN